MQRGLIILTHADLTHARELLHDLPTTTLYQKIAQTLKEAEPQSQLEVTREEVETLLDRLPPPSATADERARTLRGSLENFLHLS